MIKRYQPWLRDLRTAVALALLLGLLSLLTPAIAGPRGSQAQGQGQPADLQVSAQDQGRQIHLAADQVLAVRLEANPSTGYQWEVAEVDGQILRQVVPIAFEPRSDLLGAPGTMTLRFQPAAAGQTRLALVYRRPWEKEKALADFALEVTTEAPTSPPSQSQLLPSAPLATSPEATAAGSQPGALTALPPAFNWCDHGGCTPVKDQQSCGGCWAFATVGPLESWIKLNDGVTRDLSEQYLVSCNMEGWGCNGGWWAHDYHQWKKLPAEPEAGAVYEADFPYMAANVACNPPHPHHEKIVAWAYVNPAVDIPSTAELKQAIYDHGPLAVAVCAGPLLSNYTGGVFAYDESYYCGGGVNHGVVLVGWDEALDVWYMKNSWGPGWGEGGYVRIAYGVSKIGYGATYVVYADGGPPAAPSNLRVLSTRQTEVHLGWDDNSSNEEGFQIERSPNGHSAWNQVGAVGANITTYTDTALALSTTYHYRVRAHNANGDSDYSNVVEATTHGEYTMASYLPFLVRGGDKGKPSGLGE